MDKEREGERERERERERESVCVFYSLREWSVSFPLITG